MDNLGDDKKCISTRRSERTPPRNGYHHKYSESATASLPPSPQAPNLLSPRSKKLYQIELGMESERDELILPPIEDIISEEDMDRLKKNTSHISFAKVITMLPDFEMNVDKVIEFCKTMVEPTLLCETTEQFFISNCAFMKRKQKNLRLPDLSEYRTFHMTQTLTCNNHLSLVDFYYSHKYDDPSFMKVQKNKDYDPVLLQKMEKVAQDLEKQEQEDRKIAREERKKIREEKKRMETLENPEGKEKKRKSAELPPPIDRPKRSRVTRSYAEMLKGGKKPEKGKYSSNGRNEEKTYKLTRKEKAELKRKQLEALKKLIEERKTERLVMSKEKSFSPECIEVRIDGKSYSPTNSKLSLMGNYANGNSTCHVLNGQTKPNETSAEVSELSSTKRSSLLQSSSTASEETINQLVSIILEKDRLQKKNGKKNDESPLVTEKTRKTDDDVHLSLISKPYNSEIYSVDTASHSDFSGSSSSVSEDVHEKLDGSNKSFSMNEVESLTASKKTAKIPKAPRISEVLPTRKSGRVIKPTRKSIN